MDKQTILKRMYVIVFPITLFLSLNLYQWFAKKDYAFMNYISQNLIIVALSLVAATMAYFVTKKNI